MGIFFEKCYFWCDSPWINRFEQLFFEMLLAFHSSGFINAGKCIPSKCAWDLPCCTVPRVLWINFWPSHCISTFNFLCSPSVQRVIELSSATYIKTKRRMPHQKIQKCTFFSCWECLWQGVPEELWWTGFVMFGIGLGLFYSAQPLSSPGLGVFFGSNTTAVS